MLIMTLLGQCQIHNRQDHEDERLQGDDKNMEGRPKSTWNELNPPRHQGNQDEDELARKHVTE